MADMLLWIVIFLAAATFFTAQQTSMKKYRTQAYAKKFADLGEIRGKTKDEIIAGVGPPNAIDPLPDGKQLLQWMNHGYHIALLFEGEICQGVTTEFYPPE